MNELYNYDFILELESNNEMLLSILKKDDPETYSLLEKTKVNILFLNLKKDHQVADKLARQYRKVLIKAYGYFCKKMNK